MLFALCGLLVLAVSRAEGRLFGKKQGIFVPHARPPIHVQQSDVEAARIDHIYTWALITLVIALWVTFSPLGFPAP